MPLGPLEAGGVPPNPGGVSPEDLGLYKDLVPFWSRIGGEAVYRDAVEQVNHMWEEGILGSWADAATVVEAHAPHHAITEGLEGIGCDVGDEAEGEAEAEAAAEGAAAVEGDGGLAPGEVVVEDAAGEVRLDDGDDKPARPHQYVALQLQGRFLVPIHIIHPGITIR